MRCLRAWWQRLCEIIATRDPRDPPTDWRESQPETVWPEITEPSKLEHRP